MKKLYYVRHGQSEFNVSGHYSGTTDTPLTKEGKRQAKLAAQQAKNLNIDYIVSSPLIRALDTAKIIAKEIGYPIEKIHTNKLFIERHFGELEATPWLPDLNLDGVADIETVDSLLERSKLALEFLQTVKANHILVVGHGSFGRAFRSQLFPDQPYINTTSNPKAINYIPNAKIVSFID